MRQIRSFPGQVRRAFESIPSRAKHRRVHRLIQRAAQHFHRQRFARRRQTGEYAPRDAGILLVDAGTRRDDLEGLQPDLVQMPVADELHDEAGERHVVTQLPCSSICVTCQACLREVVVSQGVERALRGPSTADERVLDPFTIEWIDEARGVASQDDAIAHQGKARIVGREGPADDLAAQASGR